MIDIGSRLELFVDDWLIEKMDNLTVEVEGLVPGRGPLLQLLNARAEFGRA